MANKQSNRKFTFPKRDDDNSDTKKSRNTNSKKYRKMPKGFTNGTNSSQHNVDVAEMETKIPLCELIDLTDSQELMPPPPDMGPWTDSQELMPPPLDVGQDTSHSDNELDRECALHNSLYPNNDESSDCYLCLKRKRSSSRSTLILSDEENEIIDKNADQYLQRTSSKRLKKDDNLLNNNSKTPDSSCSTVFLESSSEESFNSS